MSCSSTRWQTLEPPRPLWLGDTHQHWNSFRLLIVGRREAFAYRARRHLRQLA